MSCCIWETFSRSHAYGRKFGYRLRIGKRDFLGCNICVGILFELNCHICNHHNECCCSTWVCVQLLLSTAAVLYLISHWPLSGPQSTNCTASETSKLQAQLSTFAYHGTTITSTFKEPTYQSSVETKWKNHKLNFSNLILFYIIFTPPCRYF